MLSRNQHNPSRFTLIELLVVVAIISILASILLPALGKARYRTRLSVCGSTMRQMSLGISMYAGDYNGYYPYRSVSFGNNSRPGKIKDDTLDDRPVMREAYDLNFGLCPFNQNSDIDVENSTSKTITGSYEHYFGSRINSPLPQHAMLRDTDTAQWQGQQFNVIIADMEWNYKAINRYYGSHPDRAGLMAPRVRNDSGSTLAFHGALVNSRGNIDRNFAFSDGSVILFSNLTMGDSRLVRIPARPGFTSEQNWAYIPPMQ